MLQGHFSSVLSSEPKKKPTRNKKPTRKDSHNSINIWTTFHLVVSILGLRTKISSWGINFKTIIGKVNMQKRQNQRKGKVYAHLSIADCRPRSFFDPKKSSLRCPRTLKGLISMCTFFLSVQQFRELETLNVWCRVVKVVTEQRNRKKLCRHKFSTFWTFLRRNNNFRHFAEFDGDSMHFSNYVTKE